MRPSRSLLFVPGNRPRMLEKAATTGADALVLDLEDAVPHEEKPTARQLVREIALDAHGPAIFVRINSVASSLAHEDLDCVVGPRLTGVFLPKADGPDEVKQVSGWIADLEKHRGVDSGAVEIVAMLESANSVRLAYEVAAASSRVGSVCFSSGQDGDFQTDLGSDWSLEGTELLYARSKVVLDARAAGVEYPLDGVFVDIANLDGLRADTTLSKRLGYKGRTIIHPSHVEIVNQIYTPSAAEREHYRGLLEAFASATAAGRGSARYRGRMIDQAQATRARQVLDLAEAFGVDP